jgi:hypothetical protein
MLKWYAEKPEFRQRVEEGKTDFVEPFAEEILDIADDSRNDFIERADRNGNVIRTFDHEHINQSRLRTETRKRRMTMQINRNCWRSVMGCRELTTAMTLGCQEATTAMTLGCQEATTAMTLGCQEATTAMTSGCQEATTAMTLGCQEATTAMRLQSTPRLARVPAARPH